MKISIAMTTYNGEKYIEQQLDSLYNQTIKFDELIICDDGSTDSTVKIIEDYIVRNKRFNCNLIKNDSNIGWTKNFRKALRECSGDIIFLCDQDDIWIPSKIQVMRDEIERNKRILLLASNYSVLQDSPETNGPKGFKEDNGFIKKIPFTPRGLYISRPGCTFCVRKELVNIMLANDNDSWPHDYMLWCYALTEDGLFIINQVLVKYRRHSGNVTRRKDLIQKNQWTTNIAQMELFRNYCNQRNKREYEHIISRVNLNTKKRMFYIYKRKLFQLMYFQIRNYMFYPSIKSLLCDECRILFNKH